MWKQEVSNNLKLFIRVGLPYTVIGMIIIFAGIFGIRKIFADSQYQTIYLFLWIALFWFIYQPLFRKKIRKTSKLVKTTSK